MIDPLTLTTILMASGLTKQTFGLFPNFRTLSKVTSETKGIKIEASSLPAVVKEIRSEGVKENRPKEMKETLPSKANTPVEKKPQQTKKRKTVPEISQIDERLIAVVVERVKSEIDFFSKTPSAMAVTETVDSLYLGQIAKAQEFLNENAKADLSRIKCLMRTMLPVQYHTIIDKLKQHQDPQVIVNINGGQNVVAPKATKVKQKNS